MEITINTIYGSYVVPVEKTDQLLLWLQQNAVKVGHQFVKETTSDSSQFTGRQLINE